MQTNKIFRFIELVKEKALFLLIINTFLFSGCGFQLNTNEPALIRNARSISIKKIENMTFSPGVDIRLKESLTRRLRANRSIYLAPENYSEVELAITINTNKQSISDYSVQSVNYYKHLFEVEARIVLTDKRLSSDKEKPEKQSKQIFSNRVKGSKEIRDTKRTLSTYDISKAQNDAIENLSQKIYNQLTSSF